jgi:hypothetical protein
MHGSGVEFEEKRQAEFAAWAKRLIGQKKESYHVTVAD